MKLKSDLRHTSMVRARAEGREGKGRLEIVRPKKFQFLE